ncbi:hypothetical protein JHK86_016212 [Glycine max]|nr:hypothetical protein JHK86_016212 [Glycine max]
MMFNNRPRFRNPFIVRIMDTPLPPTWKGVTLDKYDNTTDLNEYIDIYVAQVGLCTLDDVVLCKFATSQHHMVLVSLVSLQQEKKETLRSFMERFGKVALDILNLDSMVVMHHLVTTLQPKLFINSLCKKPTSNLDKLRCRATKYIQLEEFIEYNRQLRNKPTAVKKKANKDVHKPKERPREA